MKHPVINMKLTVKQAPGIAAGNDIVHIHRNDRGHSCMNKVCKISVGKKSVYATVRGNKRLGEILIDNQLRLKLGIEIGKEYDFLVKNKPYYLLMAPFYATNLSARAAYIFTLILFLISVILYFC